ncbi:phosphohistidine phosphatase SixA [Geobacter sp. FeAm09]|uniref:phosphohistidine phosphatase SixA n=1 Tax=Geobacter sp. FeAm09 TaxID=2597769 RepID=UPI0011EF74C9|nr:phosphohistidine phosphatase SixA [Geobacter sp. FeAm09]QEM67348.1 phosphohistidine phosphatase SixA [Geobacter sp. FeAm09]
MILYVLRHGEAVERTDGGDDEWRYLTERGRADVRKVVERVTRCGHKPRLILSSPLVRAVQTAEIAAQRACRKNRTVIAGPLQPDGDLEELTRHILHQKEAKRVMVVGHEPLLGSLVASLLDTATPVALKKGGCVALELDIGKDGDKAALKRPATFLWSIAPGRKLVKSGKKAFAGKGAQ